MKPPLLVTAAIIRRNARVLIARRPISSKVEAGKWEFPGGKVEGGEHPQECLVREINEELDLSIKVERFFDLSSHVYKDAGGLHIVLLCYLCLSEGGEPRAVQAAEIAWVDRDGLRGYAFAEADIPLVEKLWCEWDLVQSRHR